jgi:hypothetical protein
LYLSQVKSTLSQQHHRREDVIVTQQQPPYQGDPDRPPAEQQQPPPQYRQVEPRNALGIAALALGLVGVLFGLVPLTGFIAVGLGIVGMILALSNRGRLRRGTATNKKTTWAGLIASVVAIALGIWGIAIVFDAFEDLDEDLQEIEQELDE